MSDCLDAEQVGDDCSEGAESSTETVSNSDDRSGGVQDSMGEISPPSPSSPSFLLDREWLRNIVDVNCVDKEINEGLGTRDGQERSVRETFPPFRPTASSSNTTINEGTRFAGTSDMVNDESHTRIMAKLKEMIDRLG